MSAPIVKQVLDGHRAQLQGLIELRGVKRLQPIYEQSRAELEARLAQLRRRGRDQSFTAHHARMVLVQVADGVRQFEQKLGGHLQEQGRLAGVLGQRHLITAIKKLEKKFTGHAPQLQVEQAAVLRKVFDQTHPSLLNRYKKSERLYGKPVVTKIRDQLALSIVQGQGVDEAIDRVVGTDGIFDQQRWRAERIVRTELSYSYNVVKYRTMEEMHDRDMPDLQRKLIETNDDREGEDSKILHGQVQPMGKPFIYHPPPGKKGYKPFLMPPGRPNDRAVVIPWRPGWQDSRITSPSSEGAPEVAPRMPSESQMTDI